jgi:hypothetical protein
VSDYHQEPHDGCRLLAAPQISVSPHQMFEEGIARSGMVLALPEPESAVRLLPPRWLVVNEYGLNVDRLVYDSRVLDGWRGRPSPYPGRNGHPIRVDDRDRSRVWFFDADNHAWHAIRRRGASLIDLPFNDATVAWAKRLVVERGGDVSDPPQVSAAVDDLLDRRERGPKLSKTEKKMVTRMVQQAEQSGLDLAAMSPGTRRRPKESRQGQRDAPMDPDPPVVLPLPLPRPEDGAALPIDDGPEPEPDLEMRDGIDSWPEPLEVLD